jgi:hypothetical protein
MSIKNLEKKLLSQLIIFIVVTSVWFVVMWKKYITNNEFCLNKR